MFVVGGRGASSSGGSLRSILGAKGKERSMESVLPDVNPNFDKGLEWRTNCQRCVYATEMRARGYDVEARPRLMIDSKTPDDDDPIFKNRINLYGFKGQKWENLNAHNTYSSEIFIKNKMREWGVGSRAFVRVDWKGGGAHIFNIEQTGKYTTKIRDGQDGKTYDLEEYLKYTKPQYTAISRVDNLKTPVNSVMKLAVKKRGK